jgi:hypothetical protein
VAGNVEIFIEPTRRLGNDATIRQERLGLGRAQWMYDDYEEALKGKLTLW